MNPRAYGRRPDTFLVFSQDIPSQTLGFIDHKGATLDLTVAGKDLTIHHNRSLLASDRKQGTTGAGSQILVLRFPRPR